MLVFPEEVGIPFTTQWPQSQGATLVMTLGSNVTPGLQAPWHCLPATRSCQLHYLRSAMVSARLACCMGRWLHGSAAMFFPLDWTAVYASAQAKMLFLPLHNWPSDDCNLTPALLPHLLEHNGYGEDVGKFMYQWHCFFPSDGTATPP